MPFELLASPVTLGPMPLRNRLVLLPHGLFFADRSRLVATQRHVDYYAARARGGVGLVCLESSVVSRDGMMVAPLMLATGPGAGEGYRRIAEAVHAEGARVCGQLTHYGNQGSSIGNRAPLVGPSRLPDVALREPARPAGPGDMARLCEDFAAGAACLAAAGMDAVELKVGHDGILRQFLSPLTNDRADEYGGSVENRMRFVLAVAAAVRDVIGPGVALGIRLGIDEHLPGGYGVQDAIAFAGAFERSGLVDYLSSDAGIFASVQTVVPPMALGAGPEEASIARVADATALPVIAFGAIRTPEHAERILAEGRVAAVGMARALIADPQLGAKAFAGTPELIRPCTACNQQCVGNSQMILPVSCTVNPFVGYGERPPESTLTGTGRVVVAGGGVAGQEAARVAAEAGHPVTLFEATAELGGQLALAATAPGREGWLPYLDWLAGELKRLGVDVRLGEPADAPTVAALDPELVVIACGSTAEPTLDGAIEVDGFLADPTVGRAGRVVLVDRGAAGLRLWTAALAAAERGSDEVTIVTPLPAVGAELDGTNFMTVYGALRARGVQLMTDHVVTEGRGGGLAVTQIYSGMSGELDADTIVTCSPRVPMGAALAAALPDVATITVGDAVAPRQVYDAVRDGQSILAAAADPYLVMKPASTSNGTPVMNLEASEARNSIA